MFHNLNCDEIGYNSELYMNAERDWIDKKQCYENNTDNLRNGMHLIESLLEWENTISENGRNIYK